MPAAVLFFFLFGLLANGCTLPDCTAVLCRTSKLMLMQLRLLPSTQLYSKFIQGERRCACVCVFVCLHICVNAGNGCSRGIDRHPDLIRSSKWVRNAVKLPIFQQWAVRFRRHEYCNRKTCPCINNQSILDSWSCVNTV